LASLASLACGCNQNSYRPMSWCQSTVVNSSITLFMKNH